MNISAVEAASVVTPALVACQTLLRYCGIGVAATSSENSINSQPTRAFVVDGDDSKIGRIAIQLLRAKNATLPFARPWIGAVCERQESEAFRDESGVDEVKPLISLQRSVVAIGVRWTLYWIVPLVLPSNCPGILRGEE
ncbi:hypothetical protein N7497_001138 [Penicillium chrysogenum]|nr:hypothetical protein N7497_001138 [Penicillium chrysogenum]